MTARNVKRVASNEQEIITSSTLQFPSALQILFQLIRLVYRPDLFCFGSLPLLSQNHLQPQNFFQLPARQQTKLGTS